MGHKYTLLSGGESIQRFFKSQRHNNEIFNLTPSQGSVFENNRWKIITDIKEIS